MLDLPLKHCAAVAAAGLLAALALARVGSPEGALAALLDPAGPRAAALAALAALAWPLIDSPFGPARALRRAAPPIAIGAACWRRFAALAALRASGACAAAPSLSLLALVTDARLSLIHI